MTLNEAIILVVEDEPQIRAFLVEWFQRADSRVLAAENGQEALHMLHRNHVDLIVSDVRMPIMDGIDLARQVCRLPGYHPKILFISGFSDISDREAYSLGIEARLSKPITRRQLIPIVERCLAEPAAKWTTPPPAPPALRLDAAFESLAQAGAAGALRFGRGGFCIRSTLAARAGQTVGVRLAFAAEQQVLEGAGLVRWTAPAEQLLGVEISYLAAPAMAWAVRQCYAETARAFIPASGGG